MDSEPLCKAYGFGRKQIQTRMLTFLTLGIHYRKRARKQIGGQGESTEVQELETKSLSTPGKSC